MTAPSVFSAASATNVGASSGPSGIGEAPGVTVVLATRDRLELLRAALAAIRGQDYPGKVHCVVVFDQSEPDLDLAVDDPRRAVRVIRNTRSPGLAGARNSGLLVCQTELVAFCDDDDEWLPGKLASQVALLREHPEASVASTGIAIDYDGSLVERPAPPRVSYADLLRSRVSSIHPSTLVMRRAAVLDRIGLVDEEIPGSYGEDYEWLLRAARVGTVVAVEQPLVRVLWHRRSYFSQRWTTIIEALTWLLRQYPDFRSAPKGYARIAGQIAFAHAALGQRREALRWAGSAARRNPREARALLAVAVASGVVDTDRVLAELHRRGKGI